MEDIPTTSELQRLRFAELAPDVWSALANVERTGWVTRGVQNPETVQDHIVALRKLAASLTGLSEEEKDGLIDMLELHDWPEAICGDEVVIHSDPEERKRLKEIKFQKEKEAMEQICSKLGDMGPTVMNLWLRFETSPDPAAVLGRQLDKYQAVEQALEYEKAQGILLFEEFLNSAKSGITHPVLVQRLASLEQRHNGV